MTKDSRYKTINNLISGGYIKTIKEMFPTIPKSVMAKDLGVSSDRFNNMIESVEKFGIKTLFKMSALIEVDEKKILDLVYNQYHADKKSKKKNR